MKIAKSTDFTYDGFKDGYHRITRKSNDDYECVRELKFVDVDNDVVYYYSTDGSKSYTGNTLRRKRRETKVAL